MEDILIEIVNDFNNEENGFIDAKSILKKNTVICNRNYIICIDSQMQTRIINFNQLSVFPKLQCIENVFINKNFCFYNQMAVINNFGIFGKKILFYIYSEENASEDEIWKNFENDLENLNSDQVSAIGEGPIRNYLGKNLYLPQNIKETRHRAFINNCSIQSLSSEVALIGKDSFYKCTNLSSINLRFCETIDDNAFGKCNNLCEIHITSSLVKIGNQAFAGDINLKKINFEDALLSVIENQVFCDCSSLTSIKFPPTLKYINVGAFRNCTSLSILDFSNLSSIINTNITIEDNILPNFTIIVPDFLIDEWKQAEDESLSVNYIMASEFNRDKGC